MNRKTGKLLLCLGLAMLLVCASVLGTMAYLTKQTETKINKFSVTYGMNAMLTEPLWDGIIGYDYTDNDDGVPYYEKDGDTIVYGYTDGDLTKPVTNKDTVLANPDKFVPKTIMVNGDEKDLGREIGKLMTPGDVAPKNPFITNITGDDTDEIYSLRLTFMYGDGADTAHSGKALTDADMTRLMSLYTINYSSNWTRFTGSDAADVFQTFYYNSTGSDGGIVADGDTSAPIFTSVTLKNTATSSDLAWIKDALGGFNIKIEGYAVQYIAGTDSETPLKAYTAGLLNFPTTVALETQATTNATFPY